MKVYDDSKIYIIAPRDLFTGGPLSLHQLGSALQNLNYDVRMFYVGNETNPLHPELKKFNLPITEDLEDSEENIWIFPETLFLYMKMPMKSRIIIWWMSVDFHFYRLHDRLFYFLQDQAFEKYPSPMLNLFRLYEYDHLYQGEYARRVLTLNQVPPEKILHELRGYLAKAFYDNESKIKLDSKKDQIVYNPKKGFEFTQKIIESAPDLTFIPIQNMTPDQVQNLLSRSKVYIDFGNHPGRERIPREATMSHCVVITGRRGSANNPIDVPIDNDFKFEDDPKNIPRIISKIRYVFENFQTEHDRQNSYREVILHERDKFFHDVANIFQR